MNKVTIFCLLCYTLTEKMTLGSFHKFMFQVQNRGPPISTKKFEDVVVSVKLTSEKFKPLWSTPLASRGGSVLGLKSAVTRNTDLQRLYNA